MYFESHAHYDDERYNEDRDTLLESFPANGVSYVVNAGADINDHIKGISLAEAYDFMYAAVGVHPHCVEEMNEQHLQVLAECCAHPKAVAVGEIGLDYYYDNAPRDIQRHWFQEQLNLSQKLELPVIIHSRDAAAETFEILRDSGAGPGVVHCFSGSVEMAEAYIRMGFYIGIGGVVTFPKSKTLVAVTEAIPLEKILIETDCPYLAPVPNRGKRNDSLQLKYIVNKIAEIKGIAAEAVAEATLRNGLNLFSKIKAS